MGSLYLARDPSLDRLVAIKLLKDDYQDDEELRERFLREARSVARLRHRNIVLVFDVGEHDGRQFMAMEYLPGQTLGKLLGLTPPLPLAQRVAFVEQLCAGLAHAHAAGIVHRDIKPSNLMLDADGVLKILDFGIAHLADSGMTRDGMMMGSVNYMSPEQVVGQRVDHRTDIFAAGAVLYEVVTLTQAFPGGFDSGALNRILNVGHTPLAKVTPGVDPMLAQIIDRALDRNPEKRYQDAEVMRRDLTQVRRRLPEFDDEGEPSARETVLVPRPSSPPSGRARRDDTDRRKDTGSERFGIIRRQQAQEHLQVSRQALERGDHAAALEAAERAAAIDPDYQEAFDLMDRTKASLEAAAIAQALDEADRLVADGYFTRAESLIARGWDAATLDSPAARDLHARAQKLSERIATVRDQRRRVDSGLAQARASFEDRHFDTVLRRISEVLTIDPGNADAISLQERAKGALAAQRELELRKQQAFDRIEFARSLAMNHRYQEAGDALAAIVAPTDTVRRAVADLATFLEEQKRAAARVALLGTIRRHIESSEFEQALAAIDTVPMDERTGELRALRSRAENGLRARHHLERKRVELNRVMTAARELCAAGDFQAARDLVTEGFRLGGEDAALTEISQQIAHAESAAEQQRLQDVRDRTVSRKVESARQMALRDVKSAIGFLENDDSGHPAIAAAVQELRSRAAQQEQSAREQAAREQAAREQAARERARQEEQARERADRERVERERVERERAQQEQVARERAERERVERERAQQEQAARERAERERVERERARQEQAGERAERERVHREEAERVAREESEREEREREHADATLVLRQPSPTADETVIARPSPPPPPTAPAARRLRVPMLGGLAALIAVAVVGTILLRDRLSTSFPRESTDASPVTVTIAPTTVPPAAQPVVPAPAPVPGTGTPAVDGIVQSARSSLKRGDLTGAARSISEAVARAPQDADAQNAVAEILRAASTQAQQAKSAADQANATSRPAYQEALVRVRSADALRTARRVAPAVDAYAAAARLFGEAARAPQVAQLPTVVTTIPAAEPPATPPRPATPPATVASSIATTTIAPTTTILPSIDQDTVLRVLAAYSAASRTFNVAAIEEIYPGLPATSRTRLDALRRNYNYCDYTYSNVRIVSATATEATIRADNLESCKPKTAQRSMDTRATQQLTLRKAAAGAWTITEILGLQ
jgi:Protein kinase domain